MNAGTLVVKKIDLVTEPCPNCGQTHKAHEHRDGVTSCADGTVVVTDYPYNIVKVDSEGNVL